MPILTTYKNPYRRGNKALKTDAEAREYVATQLWLFFFDLVSLQLQAKNAFTERMVLRSTDPRLFGRQLRLVVEKHPNVATMMRKLKPIIALVGQSPVAREFY